MTMFCVVTNGISEFIVKTALLYRCLYLTAGVTWPA